MKITFGKLILASILGTLIMGLISSLFSVIMIASIIGMSSQEVETPVLDNSVLHIKLNKAIKERGQDMPSTFKVADLMSGIEGSTGLNDILDKIDGAAKDDRISGIWLELGGVQAGMSAMKEIRDKLVEFKGSGKFIFAYNSGYTQGGYYLATVADQVWVNGQGNIDFHGLGSQIMFFKNILSKLDVNVQVIRHGKYKSAVEPFLLDHMSEANREQTSKFLGSLWNTILTDISESRNISIEKLNEAADKLTLMDPNDAKAHGFVDQLAYYDEALAYLKEKTESEKLNTISLDKYSAPSKTEIGDKIAIVYAAGSIVDGKGTEEEIGGDKYAKVIRDIRLDDDVKAVVLRVNSPGGSALASELIWREIELTREVKPVIVSMSDLAASGGYYISCAADRIFAEPSTITGSIGVFGIIPDVSKLLTDRIGINIDVVKTNENADMSILQPLTPYQRATIQAGVEQVYDVFTTRVADGRGLRQTYVDSIGQGRVWSGLDAKEIGLVDEFGGIEKAIAYAAEKAELSAYHTANYPKQLDFFQQILSDITGTEDVMLKNQLGALYPFVKAAQDATTMEGIQARLPYVMVID